MPATLTISGSANRVDVGQTVLLSGVVTAADGTALPGVRVALLYGTRHNWTRVALTSSDSSGLVSLTTPPVQATAAYRFRARGVHSSRWRVGMRPLLTVSASPSGRVVVVTATAQGGSAGDFATLSTRSHHQVVVAGHGALDANGSVTFQVTPTRRHARYVVVLARTPQHTAARAAMLVTRRGH